MALWFKTGCLSACVAVGLGAFGAHGLKSKVQDEKLLNAWEVAVRYHLMHSLALLAIPGASAAALIKAPTRAQAGARLMVTGIVLFSGSLYVYALTGYKKLGMIAPIGGFALMAGWLCLAFAV